MFYHLPPVGTPISTTSGPDDLERFEKLLSPYSPVFYASGTAALAAALVAANQLKPVTDPEVLIPAYACPDLVSAVVLAGARPVLVDLEAERPWMNLDQLRERIGENTIAIVAVHLFGILERIREMKEIAAAAGTLLIEDSAQAFPSGQEPAFWRADLVVLSFGRGKPVSALGGGAVLSKHKQLAELLPQMPVQRSPGMIKRLKYNVKTYIYNRLIDPRLYWLPNSLPFLHLGETHYQPLAAILGTDAHTLLRVSANALRFRADPTNIHNAIRAVVKRLSADGKALVNLPEVCAQYAGRRLLRYPLLVSETARDTCLRSLNAAGLGATTMYPASLPAISGLEPLFAGQSACPEAERFARRILTLPTHPGVRASDVDAIERLLGDCVQLDL